MTWVRPSALAIFYDTKGKAARKIIRNHETVLSEVLFFRGHEVVSLQSLPSSAKL